MADGNIKTPGPMGRGITPKKAGRKALNPSQGSKKKDSEVMMLKMVEEGPANKHKSMKMEKMKKTTNKDGNIEFVELKAKGGRMGYKGGGMSQRGLGRAFMKGGKV